MGYKVKIRGIEAILKPDGTWAAPEPLKPMLETVASTYRARDGQVPDYLHNVIAYVADILGGQVTESDFRGDLK